MRNIKLQEQHALDEITREIDINLSGPVRMVQRFLPHLETRPEAAIVNVSSGLAFVPFPAAPIYSATKAAMHAYTLALRVQLKGTKVAVFELAPPGPETPLFRDEFEREVRGQSAMSPDVLAKKAVTALGGSVGNTAWTEQCPESHEPHRTGPYAEPTFQAIRSSASIEFLGTWTSRLIEKCSQSMC